eukprot:TRINITY_DN93969_c0_g1_i1.p1 TRINITY_DN93969_c0_g1~~TRINITY_DN93969_c0_g1_i1.p1  ORF type:complete len:233 (+),score=53.51 TRINITY_DN93969_c0_g1_i1:22-720(+)
MRSGEVWRHVRDLLDAAEDHGNLVWSLNVAAVVNGSTKSLTCLGDEVLRRGLEARLHASDLGPGAWSGWAEAQAYDLTRNGPLAEIFDVLGLDSRLRHHRKPLDIADKANVVRSIAGELKRGIDEANRSKAQSPAPWCCALLRELISTLLHMGEETMREVQTTCPNCGNIYMADAAFCRRCGQMRDQDSAVGPKSAQVQVPLQADAKLSALLSSGSASDLVDSMSSLHDKEA